MNLLDTLFSVQRQRVLAWLLLHPDQALHVRELARVTSTKAGSLHRELRKLAEVGVLLRTERGNQVLYQANICNPVYRELAGLFRKTVVVEVLREAIVPLADRLSIALIFGSVARGEELAHSDINVLVVGDVGFAEVVLALHPCQLALGREIDVVVFAQAEWATRMANGSPLAREIASHPVLHITVAKEEEPGG
jgi:predicted nucleotidyltransferase